MTNYEIEEFLKQLGVRETKAETYPNTYSIVTGSSLLAQQVNNRDSASWKKAEYIILSEAKISENILNGWKKLTERDPLPIGIQKLCVPSNNDMFDVYDSQGKLVESNSLDKIVKHIPDIIDSLNKNSSIVTSQVENSRLSPTQIIYYGVPGCGKSFAVNKKINGELEKLSITDKEFHKVRCVFHPEYSNADFIGQIYPYVKPDNGGVEYRFKPGPFTEIIRRAYLNPTEPFFLIIEEINRGNAAAIFGEMFQLLDRIEPGDSPDTSTENIYDVGWSAYGVNNDDVNAYIRQNTITNANEITYAEFVTYNNQIKFSLNTAIRLPPNLSVYGTMNTSDQNVFTMDNAFQRRFQSKMIRNNLTDTNQYNLRIGDTEVCWGDFRKWINKKILAPETGLVKAEDKCLGGWFIKGKKNGNIPKDEFAEKVLKYLWNDVFKRHVAESVFNKEVHSLMSLIESFESNAGFAAFEKAFALTDEDEKELKPEKENV